MSLLEDLKQIGLNKSEAKIYLYLLELGMATPPQIAKGTGILRTNCYNILNALKGRGLIGEEQKGKRMRYVAKNPQVLLASLDQRKTVIEELLPDLQGLFGSQTNKPKVRFYDGFEEVKEIYIQSLSSNFIKAFGAIKPFSELDPKFFLYYQKELKSRKIAFRELTTRESQEGKGALEATKILGELYETVLLPKQYRELGTDILLWDDNVALIALAEPVFGTVLTNKALSKTFHIIFDSLWERMKSE